MNNLIAVDPLIEREDSARMIGDSAAEVLSPAGVARARALRFSLPGFERTKWTQFAELGWLMLRLPEDRGGLGLGMSEYCALAHEMGRALVPEPLIGAIAALELLPDADLPSVLEGRRIVLPALSANPANPVRLDAGRVTGEAINVPMAAGADAFVLRLATGGYVLVERDAAGLTIEAGYTHDGGHLGTICLAGSSALVLAETNRPVWEDATLATAAYLRGVADAAFSLTLDFLKTREQFGKPIGSFQVLQHRMVDLYLEKTLLQVSVAAAAAAIDVGSSGSDRRAEVSRARARASRAVDLICRQGVQLHGGIGFSDEADIGLYLRKSMVMLSSFGGEALHRQRHYAELGVSQ